MAIINIEFDGKVYPVDEATLLPLVSPLEKVLIQQLAGTGAVIRLGGTDYEVDATKLASTRNVLTNHLGNVTGTDSKVTVNGVEYGLSKTKLQSATDKMNETLDGMAIKPSEGLAYELNADGASYSVIGIGTCEDTDVVIPATYEGLPVTELKTHTKLVEYPEGQIVEERRGTFSLCTSLTSVTIPDGVTSICDGAFFSCDSLTNITIPDSITYIGDGAFEECFDLLYNEYDNGKYLGNSSNPYVVLCKVVDRAVTVFSIPAVARIIYDSALAHCDSLTNITIPDSVISIGESAFGYCDSLKYNEYNNGKYLGNSKNPYIILVDIIDTSTTSFTIHNTTKFIHSSAFEDCNSLTSIEIPDSVISIGYGAFYDCTSLTSVTIGNGVKKIGDSAFYNCTGLTSIEIPDSTTYIGNEAFQNCSNLTSVTIGNGVESIGRNAFYECSNLTSVTIGDSVKYIGDSAFYKCTSLTSVTIPKSVKSIYVGAFWRCTSLENIYINKDEGSLFGSPWGANTATVHWNSTGPDAT